MPLTNLQYANLIRIYDRRRDEAERTQREHLEHIRATIPEYAALEDKATDIAMDFGMRKISDPSLDLTEMDRALDEIHSRQMELLAGHGISPDYLEVHYTCPICQDTGYIDGVKCSCFKQEAIRLLYNRSNIMDLIKTDNFAAMREDILEGEDLEHFRNAVNSCKEFISDFDLRHDNMILTGTVGTGKSFLSGCIAHDLIESGHSVIYFSASDFFDTCAANDFNRRKTEDDSEDTYFSDNDLYDCDLLIIDDLGTETYSSYVNTSLFNTMNARFNRNKSTLISTNLSLSQLHERYSDRIFSRLTGHYIILKLTGPDLRMKLRNR